MESVNVKVSFNNGAQYVNTGSEFTYRYNKYEIDEPDSHISKAFSVLPSIVFHHANHIGFDGDDWISLKEICVHII